MTQFINFDPEYHGLTINTYRRANAVDGTVRDLVEGIDKEYPVCCPLDGALDALEDSSFWDDEQQDLIETLHRELNYSMMTI